MNMPEYELSQTNSGVRRGRCIAPIADLPALWISRYPDEKLNQNYRASVDSRLSNFNVKQDYLL
jgi:hypothetical protein